MALLAPLVQLVLLEDPLVLLASPVKLAKRVLLAEKLLAVLELPEKLALLDL